MPIFYIVAYYYTRRCGNYKITVYYNTYRPSLQHSCDTKMGSNERIPF
jgi:hypothetical protein